MFEVRWSNSRRLSQTAVSPRIAMANISIPALVLILATIIPLHGAAADIFLEQFRLNIVGEIRSGDAERIAQLSVDQVIKKKRRIGYVYLNSPGGDVAEAIQIADLVAGMRPDVIVSKGGICASSCFLIFLAGHERIASWVPDNGSMPTAEQRAKRFGLVGIHRPYLRAPSGDVESVKRQEELMRKFRSHLSSKQVPQYLVDEMMARPSNDIYWLKDRDLELIGPFSAGDEEALIARCGYKRTAKIIDEDWSEDRRNKLTDCGIDYWQEQYFEPQVKFVFKLSTGWRPWSGK